MKLKEVAVLLAEGFEEIEALTIIDILRRGGVKVRTASIVPHNQCIIGCHLVPVVADCNIADLNANNLDGVILPGGLPGAEYLAKSKSVQQLLQKMDSQNKMIAAICAAPIALSMAGVLKERFTCYPTLEEAIEQKGYISDEKVVVCENVITSQGPSTAMIFALTLLELLQGKEEADAIRTDLLL